MSITLPPEKAPKPAWTPLKGIVAIIIFLLLAWGIWALFFGSGVPSLDSYFKAATSTPSTPDKPKDTPKDTTEPPPIDDIDTITDDDGNTVPTPDPSFYKGSFSLGSGTAKSEVYPEKEYVTINVTQGNLSPLNINDWSLQNSAGKKVRLGSGTQILFGGKYEPYIQVKAGDRLTIVSGPSPVAPWFRVNKCSGYLEQFEDFVPPLSTHCPTITSEAGFQKIEKNCQAFMRTIPVCQINVNPLPNTLSTACKEYVNNSIGYTVCVAKYQNDSNFSTNEWRVYLGQSIEMWKAKGETIRLLDAVGKPIAEVKY